MKKTIFPTATDVRMFEIKHSRFATQWEEGAAEMQIHKWIKKRNIYVLYLAMVIKSVCILLFSPDYQTFEMKNWKKN